jgi:hypothetical protein
MLSSLKGFIQVASNNNAVFSNTKTSDFTIFTSCNSQNIFMGTKANLNTNASMIISSNSIVMNENVGVGKTPAYPLDVAGDVNFTGTLRQNNVPFQTSRWSSNANGIFFMSNVGIGKTATGYPLDVAGDVNFTGTLRQNNVPFQTSRWSSNANGIFFMSNVSIGTSNSSSSSSLLVNGTLEASNIIMPGIINLRGLEISKNAVGTGANLVTMVTNIPGYNNTSNTNFTSSNNFIFNAGATEVARLTGTGRLGLGNNNPAYSLDVTGDVNFTGTLRQNNVPFQTSRWSSNTTGIHIINNVGIGTNNPIANLDVMGSCRLGSHVAPLLSTSGVVIQSSNINLLDSSAQSNFPLLLYSTTNNNIEGTGIAFTSYNGGVVTTDGAIAPGAAITFKRTGTWSTGDMIFKTRSGSNTLDPCVTRMVISSSGNVGIGTSNPSLRLDVTGDMRASTIRVNGNFPFGGNPNIEGVHIGNYTSGRPGIELVGATDGIIDFTLINSDHSGRIYYNHGTNAMTLKTAGADQLHITNTGNVGIGTVSPADKLHVVGCLNLQNGEAGAAPLYTTNQITFGFLGNNHHRHAIRSRHKHDDNVNNALDFYIWQMSDSTNNGIGTRHVMTLNFTGVGIGTRSPTNALDVVGNAKVTGNISAGGIFSTANGTITINSGFQNLFAVTNNQSYLLTMMNGTGDGTWGLSIVVADEGIVTILSGNNIQYQITGGFLQVKSVNNVTYNNIKWSYIRLT